MVKVVFLIMSGDAKMDLALLMASRSLEAKRYEDLRVILFGPSQERLMRLEGMAKDAFEKLLSAGAVDSACIAYAKASGIEDGLVKMGVRLMPAGERVAHYLNNGYHILTF
jgi:hypothetical protein